MRSSYLNRKELKDVYRSKGKRQKRRKNRGVDAVYMVVADEFQEAQKFT